MIYKDGIWVKESICDLTADKQNEIRAEATEAYKFFGYEGERLKKAIAKAMDSDLGEVCNLIGAYKFILDNEEMTADIICGKTADSAIQSEFM